MHSTYFSPVLNMGLNITCTKSRNSCICTRHTAYLCSTWIPNM